MTDPRFTDPHLNDPRRGDPTIIEPTPLRDANTGGVWGWIAGLAVVALIAFVVIAGWNNASDTTASNASNPTPVATGNAPMRNVTPPSTTGSGSTSPLTNPATRSAPPANTTPPASAPQQQ